ncbi:MAG: hypothetical protein MJZ11_08450 [Lachnospiraceae bacterium]|nr:hypothetical protein [Lachnospiraceae bacterium]
MKDRKNPLANIIEFCGPKGWVAKVNSVMNELQGSLSDYEAFDECYLLFSPKDITPANRKEYKEFLRAKIIDKLAETLVMLEGLGVLFGEKELDQAVVVKGNELFARYEEELSNCIAVADYMKNLGKVREDNKKPRQKEV